jgi:plasmid stability protein
MSNLTISVDDELIKQARVRAIQQGTSLSAKVREFLQQYVNETDDVQQKRRDEATTRLMAAIDSAATQANPPSADTGAPRRTLREELYEGDFRQRDRDAVPRHRR